MDVQQTMVQATEHLRAGRLAEAEGLFRQVIAQQGNHADALHLLGCTASKLGRPEEAAEFMRRAVEADPSKSIYHVNLGAVLLGLGKKEEAIPLFRAAISLRPDVHTYYLLGNALCSVGKFDEAAPCFKWAIAAEPEYAPHHFNLGNCWLGKAVGIRRDAASERNQAFQQAAECFERRFRCGRVSRRRGTISLPRCRRWGGSMMRSL